MAVYKQTTLEEDIEAALYLLKSIDYYNEDCYFDTHSAIYPYTNENLAGYFKKMYFKDKKVLTVCGSGDHYLNAVTMNAKKVDCFDINAFAWYYLNLKIAAILSLSRREFIRYFDYKEHPTVFSKLVNQNGFLCDDFYARIRRNLDDEIRNFWDALYDNAISWSVIRHSSLFKKDVMPPKIQFGYQSIKNNIYLRNDIYYARLKKLLVDNEFDFYVKDARNIKELKGLRYDLILLSNILAHLDNEYEEDSIEEIVENFFDLTEENGQIASIYLYGHKEVEENIYRVERLAKDKESTIIEFSGSACKRDAQLVLKKAA